MSITIDRKMWNRGKGFDKSFLCNNNGQMDVLGFYLNQKGIDTSIFCDKVDVLELVYSGKILPESISSILIVIDLNDSEYSGRHWTLNPIVNDLILVNDADLNQTPSINLSDGGWRVHSEEARESLIRLKFEGLGEVVKFVG